jgi:hypothetical protein
MSPYGSRSRAIFPERPCAPVICSISLRPDSFILSLLSDLPRVAPVSDDEALFFIERHRLHGRGLGLVDIHLLASCAVEGNGLWSKDVRLMKTAKDLKLAARLGA